MGRRRGSTGGDRGAREELGRRAREREGRKEERERGTGEEGSKAVGVLGMEEIDGERGGDGGGHGRGAW